MHVETEIRKYEKLLILGPYPPPLGGVSVYIYRLMKSLPNSKCYDFSGGGLVSYINLFFYLLRGGFDSLYLNNINFKLIYIVGLVLFFKRFDLFIADHNDQLLKNKNRCHIFFYRKLLEKVKGVKLVGPHIHAIYDSLRLLDETKVDVSSAFIAPPIDDEQAIRNTYPSEYIEFVKKKNSIILTSAFRLIQDEEVDLYGIDLCLEAISYLRNKRPTIGLVVFLADGNYNQKYYRKLQSIIKEDGLSEFVHFVEGQKEMWPAFIDSDIYIRATSRDGFGVTVSESLYFNCPSIASDVCDRAEGAIIFKSRDVEDLIKKIEITLDRKN